MGCVSKGIVLFPLLLSTSSPTLGSDNFLSRTFPCLLFYSCCQVFFARMTSPCVVLSFWPSSIASLFGRCGESIKGFLKHHLSQPIYVLLSNLLINLRLMRKRRVSLLDTYYKEDASFSVENCKVLGKKTSKDINLHDIPTLVVEIRRSYNAGTSKPIKRRLEQLKGMF